MTYIEELKLQYLEVINAFQVFVKNSKKNAQNL